jgi:hypothetical protein
MPPPQIHMAEFSPDIILLRDESLKDFHISPVICLLQKILSASMMSVELSVCVINGQKKRPTSDEVGLFCFDESAWRPTTPRLIYDEVYPKHPD